MSTGDKSMGTPQLRTEVEALLDEGIAHFQSRDLARSRACFSQALRRARRKHDRHGEARSLANLGSVHVASQNDHAAADSYTAAVHLFQELRDRERESLAIEQLIRALVRLRQLARVSGLAERFLDMSTDVGARSRVHRLNQLVSKEMDSSLQAAAGENGSEVSLAGAGAGDREHWVEFGMQDIPFPDALAHLDSAATDLGELAESVSSVSAANAAHATRLRKAADRLSERPRPISSAHAAYAQLRSSLLALANADAANARAEDRGVGARLRDLRSRSAAVRRTTREKAQAAERMTQLADEAADRTCAQLERARREMEETRVRMDTALREVEGGRQSQRSPSPAASQSAGAGSQAAAPQPSAEAEAGAEPGAGAAAGKEEEAGKVSDAARPRLLRGILGRGEGAAGSTPATPLARTSGKSGERATARAMGKWQQAMDRVVSAQEARDAAQYAQTRARCARDECLRDLAGQLETAQRASLNELRDALLEMCRAEKLALVARQEALERLESSLHRVDPASDRRIFCHDARMRAWLADAGDARYSPLRDGARLIEPLAVRIRAVGTGAEGSARPRDTGSGAGVREGDEEEEDGEGSDDAASPAPRRHSQSPPTHVLDEACRGLVQRIFSGEAPARRREDAPLVRSAGASPDEPASGAYALAQAVRGLDACPSSVAAVPLRSRSVRAALLRVLNAQRSARTAVGAGFDTLASILWVLLDAAAAEGDVHAAKSAMILSQTFYREDTSAAAPTVGQDPGATEAQGRRHRRFLQSELAGHPLWQSLHFWEEAFLTSVREEASKNLAAQVLRVEQARQQQEEAAAKGSGAAALFSLRGGQDAARAKRAHSARLHELGYQYQHLIFGQLGSFTHNMVAFGVPPARVRRFVARMCAACQLSEEQEGMVLATVDAAAAAPAAEEGRATGTATQTDVIPPSGDARGGEVRRQSRTARAVGVSGS